VKHGNEAFSASNNDRVNEILGCLGRRDGDDCASEQLVFFRDDLRRVATGTDCAGLH